MENLVETLQTHRAELLATHAATNDREAAQQLVQQLKAVSEELELAAHAAARPAALSADFYASSLLLALLAKNLNDARFLWKRIPSGTKDAAEELRAVWEIGKALWQR
jgi:hypothetical protein